MRNFSTLETFKPLYFFVNFARICEFVRSGSWSFITRIRIMAVDRTVWTPTLHRHCNRRITYEHWSSENRFWRLFGRFFFFYFGRSAAISFAHFDVGAYSSASSSSLPPPPNSFVIVCPVKGVAVQLSASRRVFESDRFCSEKWCVNNTFTKQLLNRICNCVFACFWDYRLSVTTCRFDALQTSLSLFDIQTEIVFSLVFA